MKIAIPIVEGSLAMHFGHCEQFAVLEVDDTGKILSKSNETPPAHAPGVLPEWLHGLGATHVVAGGMGSRAQQLFVGKGIQVIVGAPSETPEELVSAFVSGKLASGDNICDH